MAYFQYENRIRHFSTPLIYVDEDYIRSLKSSKSSSSLLNISIARISVSLWLQDEMRSEIVGSCKFHDPLELKNYLYTYREKWAKTERKTLGFIHKLTVPQSCEKRLKKSVKLVGEQILYFLYYRLCSDADKINIYLDNLRWTSQGMVDKVKTTLLLLEHDGLSTLEKYELACTTCLEEKIRYYLAKLPENFINEFIEVKKFRIMVYWTLHLNGEHERFVELRKREYKYGSPLVKYMFDWSYDSKNEVAVQYFMDKCTDNSIQENLLAYTKNSIHDKSTLLLPHLMAHMEPNHLHELCTRNSFELINRFAKDWRLISYFLSTARYALQFINDMDVLDGIKTLLLCWNENVVEEQKCKDMLHELVDRYRGESETTKFTSICSALLNSLFALEAVETIKLLLSKGNTTVKAQIIYSPFGLKECKDLIIKGKFKYVELFIAEMVGTKVDVHKFKSSFFHNNSFEISDSLITLSNYQILEEFLTSFSYDDEIKSFKLELPYKDRAVIISNILKCSSYIGSDQLKAIDEFLYWCFEGDLLKMSNCKVEVFERDPHYKKLQEQFSQQIFELVIKNELRLVNTYLNWAYYASDRILKFKTRFFEKRSFEICCYTITGDKYRLLDEFLNMFCIKNEISTFKYSLPVGKQGKIIKELLKMTNSTNTRKLFLLKFFNYSFEENEKIVTFVKEKVIDQGKDIDNDCREIFLEKVSLLMKEKKWPLVDKFMKWAFAVEEKPEAEEEEIQSPSENEEIIYDKQVLAERHYRYLRSERARTDRVILERRNRVLHNYFARRTFRRHRPTQ